MKGTEPMRQTSYVDSAERSCPCGSMFTFTRVGVKLKEWMRIHRKHTNGKLLHRVGYGWQRVYLERPEDYETDLD